MSSQISEENILKMSSEDLAAMIVIHRALGSYKTEAKLCMIELSKRKINGDPFDYETFIKENSEKYKININLISYSSMKTRISKSVIETLMEVGSTKTDSEKNEKEADDAEEIDENI